MKFYSLLLSIFISLLLLYHSWAQPLGGPAEEEQTIEEAGETESGFTPLDNSQVTSNPQLQGLVFLGVQSATQQAIQDGSLPEGNYQFSQIISAAQNQDDYRFEVEVTDSQGNTADVLFFITYDSSAGTTEVTSYEVLNGEGGESTTELGEGEFGEFGEMTETADGFETLDPIVAEIDTEIAGIVNVGVQEVVKQAIANGSLLDSTYELIQVHSVQQNIANPNEYRFKVDIINSDANTATMGFELAYDEANKTVEILSWGYPDSIPPEKSEETISDEIPAGYQQIEFDLNNPNSLTYRLAQAGLQVVITTGLFEGTLPSYNYAATNVRSVSVKFEAGTLYYRFDVDGSDGSGSTARFIYVVSYDTATSIPKLEDFQITDVVRAS